MGSTGFLFPDTQQSNKYCGNCCIIFASLLFLLFMFFSAHVLTEEAEGETPMIPSDIMEYSIGQAATVDINTTLKVLASPGERVDAIPGGIQSTDPVVR